MIQSGVEGKCHSEDRAAGPRLHAERAAVLLGHNAPRGVEAEAGADPLRLGREEGFEDPVKILLGDAWAVVLDLDDGVVPVATGADRDCSRAVRGR